MITYPEKNNQITNSAAMLFSAGPDFINKWLGSNTGKGIYASKYRATNTVYTNSIISFINRNNHILITIFNCRNKRR